MPCFSCLCFHEGKGRNGECLTSGLGYCEIRDQEYWRGHECSDYAPSWYRPTPIFGDNDENNYEECEEYEEEPDEEYADGEDFATDEALDTDGMYDANQMNDSYCDPVETADAPKKKLHSFLKYALCGQASALCFSVQGQTNRTFSEY